MNQKDVFARVIDILNELKIPYMIVGSIASILYGKPRLTLISRSLFQSLILTGMLIKR